MIPISNILNSLLLKGKEGDEEIDAYLNQIINRIEVFLNENNLFLVFDWLNECIKKEFDLKKKKSENPFVYNKPATNTLIMKTNMLHSKIIEMAVEKIDECATIDTEESKIFALSFANKFIANCIEHRDNDEKTYDRYLQVIFDALIIFDER